MPDFEIRVRTNVKELEKTLNSLERKQLPFATSLALNLTAADVKNEEQNAMESVFDGVTAFTKNSMAIIPALKDRPEVILFVKDKQAEYLEPYENGGRQVLTGGKAAILNPKGVRTNQYGNIPRNEIARLKGKSNVFVGAITFKKSGEKVSGVWERRPRGKVTTRRMEKWAGGPGRGPGLKLLVRFTDPVDVGHIHLDYRQRAEKVVRTNFPLWMQLAMNRAMETAKKK